MKNMIVFTALIGLLIVGIAPSTHGQGRGDHGSLNAVALLYPTLGNKVAGIVTFTKVDNGVRVVADVQGLTPGKHGFHVHQFGNCSAPNGDSAGGHFNPSGKPHGGPLSMERHAGDFGNLTAEADGKAHLEWTDPTLTLAGPDSIIGRSVIVHAMADDLTTQPAGNSGPRVACGVIGISGK